MKTGSNCLESTTTIVNCQMPVFIKLNDNDYIDVKWLRPT